jgi:hypothetical protein
VQDVVTTPGSRDTVKRIRDGYLALEQQHEQGLTSDHSSLGGFGDRRACLRLGVRNCSPYCRVLPHDRSCRLQADSDGTAFVDKGALDGNSFDDILGGQYRRHPATTSKRAPPCFRKLWFKPL